MIEASERGPLPLRLTKMLGERHVQMVVVDPQSPVYRPPSGWTPVMEIDPTSSDWTIFAGRFQSCLRLFRM